MGAGGGAGGYCAAALCTAHAEEARRAEGRRAARARPRAAPPFAMRLRHDATRAGDDDGARRWDARNSSAGHRYEYSRPISAARTEGCLSGMAAMAMQNALRRGRCALSSLSRHGRELADQLGKVSLGQEQAPRCAPLAGYNDAQGADAAGFPTSAWRDIAAARRGISLFSSTAGRARHAPGDASAHMSLRAGALRLARHDFRRHRHSSRHMFRQLMSTMTNARYTRFIALPALLPFLPSRIVLGR